MTTRISSEDRQHLEEALAAALLLIWQERADEAMADLGLAEKQFHATPEMIARLNAEAADVARTVQEGINTRLDTVGTDGTTLDDVQSEVESYNQNTLLPYLDSFARHAALLAVYEGTPNPDDPSQSMKDAVQWEWQKFLEYEDDCQRAADASPTSYDDLVQIAGSAPPAHRNCPCQLVPLAQ